MMLRIKACVLVAVLALAILPGCANKPFSLDVKDGGTLDLKDFGKISRNGCAFTLTYHLDKTGIAGQVLGEGVLYHKDNVHNTYVRAEIKECRIQRLDVGGEPIVN